MQTDKKRKKGLTNEMHRNTVSGRTERNGVLRILVAFDDGYTLPTKVMLESLILNNPTYKIEVYVLYYSLTEQNITSLRELESERVSFVFQKIRDEALESFPLSSKFPKECYIRLFAHEYLDESIDRILWLDGDIIVNGNIQEFYEQDFGGKCFVAVKDMGIFDDPYHHERLGLPEGKEYVNSGVLLINLVEIKKKACRDAVMEFIEKKRSSLIWFDQDVLNGVFYNEIKVVDQQCTFNYFASKITVFNEKRVLKEKRIIHYATPSKPWKENCLSGGVKLWWLYGSMVSGNWLESDLRKIRKTHIKRRFIHEIGSILKVCSPKLYEKCLSVYLNKIE